MHSIVWWQNSLMNFIFTRMKNQRHVASLIFFIISLSFTWNAAALWQFGFYWYACMSNFIILARVSSTLRIDSQYQWQLWRTIYGWISRMNHVQCKSNALYIEFYKRNYFWVHILGRIKSSYKYESSIESKPNSGNHIIICLRNETIW